MRIRELNVGDTEEHRALRLRPLQGYPMAFSSSYEEQRDWASETFRERLRGTFERPDAFIKPLTATLVMQQVERGAISLEAPVADYIPEFAQNGKEKVTAGHLLSHSSGLSEDSGLWEIQSYDEIVEDVCKRGLRFEPGTPGSYWTVGFTVTVEILRRVTGKGLNEIGDEQLFGPLGMSSTQMMRGDGWRNAMVPLFDNDLKVVEERSPPSKDFSMLGGAGACSSAPDIAALCQMMLNGGSYVGARVLSPVSVQRMTERQYSWWDSPERLTGGAVARQQTLSKGMGWMVRGESHFRGSDLMRPKAFF